MTLGDVGSGQGRHLHVVYSGIVDDDDDDGMGHPHPNSTSHRDHGMRPRPVDEGSRMRVLWTSHAILTDMAPEGSPQDSVNDS